MSAPTLLGTVGTTAANPSRTFTPAKGNFMLVVLAQHGTSSVADTSNNSWQVLQSGVFNSSAWTAIVWTATANASVATTVSVTCSDTCDLIVNRYSAAVVDVFSPVASGSGSSIQSAAINTTYATELIVGWADSPDGISTANSPFTFDAGQATTNRTASDTVSATGSFHSNFTNGGNVAWATGVLGLVNPSDIPTDDEGWLSLALASSMRGLRK
jgi:hypothetical protein